MHFSRHQTVTAALSLSAIWLLTHRYHGIHHDALFYAVQALAHAAPARFEHDLFFAFGSQDDYTLFTPVYAWLSKQVGLGRAAFMLLVAAQCIWVFAVVQIARQWLHGIYLVAGLALLFALPGQYGYDPVFHYAESFLTARVWAENLVLAGVAATMRGRIPLSAAALGGACLLHPIMALPGVLFLAAYHGQKYWKWLPLMFVLVLAAALAMPAMDAPWIELVRRRAPFVFIDQWRWQEWLEPFTWIGVLLAAARGVAPARNAFLALALTGTAGDGTCGHRQHHQSRPVCSGATLALPLAAESMRNPGTCSHVHASLAPLRGRPLAAGRIRGGSLDGKQPRRRDGHGPGRAGERAMASRSATRFAALGGTRRRPGAVRGPARNPAGPAATGRLPA
jgi:hypothetical protein